MKQILLVITTFLLLFSAGNAFAAEGVQKKTSKIVHQQVQKKSMFGRVKSWFTGDEVSDEEKALIMNERQKKKKIILLKRRREQEKAEKAEEAGKSKQKTIENKKAVKPAEKGIESPQTNRSSGGSPGQRTGQGSEG